MFLDPELEAQIRARMQRAGFRMPENNLRQARIIPSAQPIPNPYGTAPGWWVEKDGHLIVSMPGVPREMYRMWEEQVAPRLRERAGVGIIRSRTFKTMGMSESGIDELLEPWLPSRNPTVAVYAKPDGIWVRITAKAETEWEAQELLARMDEQIRPVLQPYLWGFDDQTLESVIGDLLVERDLTLATMESCTGGLIASTITDVPGSSRYFKGGIVSYMTEVKELAGVDPELIRDYGVVSPQVAQAMALAVRERLHADIGLGITGVAGPDPLDGHPVGTVFICVTDGRWKRSYQGTTPQARLEFKSRATRLALLELRRLLLGEGEPLEEPAGSRS